MAHKARSTDYDRTTTGNLKETSFMFVFINLRRKFIFVLFKTQETDILSYLQRNQAQPSIVGMIKHEYKCIK